MNFPFRIRKHPLPHRQNYRSEIFGHLSPFIFAFDRLISHVIRQRCLSRPKIRFRLYCNKQPSTSQPFAIISSYIWRIKLYGNLAGSTWCGEKSIMCDVFIRLEKTVSRITTQIRDDCVYSCYDTDARKATWVRTPVGTFS